MADTTILTPWERGVFKRALAVLDDAYGGLSWEICLSIHNGERETAAADYNVALAGLIDLAEGVAIDVSARPCNGNRTAELYGLAVECGYGVPLEDGEDDGE